MAGQVKTTRWVAAGGMALLLLLLLGPAPLAGCAGRGERRGGATPTPVVGTPPAVVVRPLPAGTRLLRIDALQSLLTVQVFRAGPLASLGHDHVIAARELSGTVELAEPPAASRVTLRIMVAGLTVDEPALRARAGATFAATVPDAAREGTRRNLLGPSLLDAAQHPAIELESTAVLPTADGVRLTLRVHARLRDHESSFEVPVALAWDGAVLQASGTLTLQQTQLGLVPFSVMMGALQVQDAMQLEFRIVARP